MDVPSDLRRLVERDRLERLPFSAVPTFVHDDHRFILPIVYWAQRHGRLPLPCKLVMFDRHSDDLRPQQGRALEMIRAMRASEPSVDDLLTLTDGSLSDRDDDWLLAGMELGLFSDAVVFGAEDLGGAGLREFQDHRGEAHRIWINASLPGDCFGVQGNLGDIARKYEVRPLWEILQWGPRNGRMDFTGTEVVALSVDLDAFAIEWQDFTFPWPEEVWTRRFLKESTYDTTQGWTGKRFVEGLCRKSALLTIAREPAHCGGEAKARQILKDLNEKVLEAAWPLNVV